jgi:hypothetical protein
MGDCNDCDPLVNPGATQIPGDPIDYACNGMPGVVATCTPMSGATDATSMAQAFEQCDPRFFKGAMLVGPSDSRARAIKSKFGTVAAKAGANMALISTGLALDKNDTGFVEPQQGTNLADANTFMNPLPSIPANPMCSSAPLGGGGAQPATVNDYTELVVSLKAPTNANSFSFQFQFFSAEYPEFVCTMYNDEFLVMMESPGEFQTPTNISYDMNKDPITVNNGLFTVCQNWTASYTMNCKSPVSDMTGTGYEDMATGGLGGSIPIGGSTGWLTTTAPVTPGEEVTLHFIIFDEGDHIYDSAVLIDNFQWSATATMAPSTIN